MKEKTKAYVAGLVDAEGCFNITKQITNLQVHYHPRFIIASTYKPIIKWMVKHFGGSLYVKKAVNERRESYHWKTNSKEHTCRAISLIYPYLVLKQKEAAVLTRFCQLSNTHNKSEREQLYLELKRLKTRKSVTTDTQDFPFSDNLKNAYFAGFFDGEGCITMAKSRAGYIKPLKITVGNTWRNPLTKMTAEYGGRESSLKIVSKNSPVFHWVLLQSEQQQPFLLKMLPYLIIKRSQALLGLEIRRWGSNHQDPEKRTEYYNRLQQLNNGKKIQSRLQGDLQSVSTGT